MRKRRANVYTWADLLILLSEFNIANLNKVMKMFTSCYLIVCLFILFTCKFKMIVNEYFLKLSKSMIVSSYSSTSASELCGRDGYVDILYTKYFSCSHWVNTLY